MTGSDAGYLIDVPSTLDPEKLREFIAYARSMEDQDDAVRASIKEAEAILRGVEQAEQRDAA